MPDSSTFRTIDASLNRAAEGLRVIEDYVRLVLDDTFLTELAKQLRHDLADVAATFSQSQLYAARETIQDVGTSISIPSEESRLDPADVCLASLKRVQQSLRSLEEYGKIIDGNAASRFEALRFETLRYRAYTLEKTIGIHDDSCQRLEQTRLMVLMDGCHSEEEFERQVAPLVEAGAGAIQLRDKTLDDCELIGRARLLRKLTHGTNTLMVINDRADIAAIARSDAVHLGQDDLSVKDARAIVGTEMLIGVSTHNLQQMRKAVLDGANYLGAGPTFPSTTKTFTNFAGLEFLQQVATETQLPVFAIGGIGPDNIHQVLETGIRRVAVGAAVTRAENPAATVAHLQDSLNKPTPDLQPLTSDL